MSSYRLNEDVISLILKSTQAKSIERIEVIQSLWNNYGQLSRLHLKGSEHKSVILKHAIIPKDQLHPKGFNSSISQQRKIKSYHVETAWYQKYNSKNLTNSKSITAKCFDAFQKDGEFFILLEDLNVAGYSQTPSSISFETIEVVLKWLANFHAKFLQVRPSDLWEVGTYWHLKTRPDELEELDDQFLKESAPLIDKKLNHCKYQTIVHGDAKLANFCFSSSMDKVSAVDFQYVGGGCGMKDVAYFIGSCLDETSSENLECDILKVYFDELRISLSANTNVPEINIEELITEWKNLYHLAWADFHRFLKGWSPGHWKINTYSEKITRLAIQSIFQELCDEAELAARDAGELIMSFYQKDYQISHKGGNSEAASIVTEADVKSQKIILKHLEKSIQKYDLGLLAEESDNDQSRLSKDFFWAIDPIDGTLSFSKGEPGFAVSIALIAKSGQSYVGVVLDPVRDELFTGIKNNGSTLNGKAFEVTNKKSSRPTLFNDYSLIKKESYQKLKEQYEIRLEGGAVINALMAVRTPNSFYFKAPKNEDGGCCIWDLAATNIIIQEAGGYFLDYAYRPLNFNKPHSIYYNEEGFFISSQSSKISES